MLRGKTVKGFLNVHVQFLWGTGIRCLFKHQNLNAPFGWFSTHLLCPLGRMRHSALSRHRQFMGHSLACHSCLFLSPYSTVGCLIHTLCYHHFLFLIIHHHTDLLRLNIVFLPLITTFHCPLVYALAQQTPLYFEECYQDTMIPTFVLSSALILSANVQVRVIRNLLVVQWGGFW